MVIEQDEGGVYVGRVPEIRGCLSQGDTMDELMANMREAIALCLEVEAEKPVDEEKLRFVGVQAVEVV